MVENEKAATTSRMEISVAFDTEEEARVTAAALKVDDDDFVSTSVQDRTVTGTITADTVESARRAADDWLACLMAVARKG